MLYANGTIGGIINVVNNTIAREDLEKQEITAGLETQSVNEGDVQDLHHSNNIGGFNLNFGYRNTEFGNFDIPDGAVIHEEGHDDHDDHGDEVLSMWRTLILNQKNSVRNFKNGKLGLFWASF